MTDFNGFKGRAKKLDDIDLPRIGARIGVGEDELHAFMEVEAAGSGFDSKGRPKMLFEPHVFYRNLTGAKRKQAVAAGLAYAKWKSGNYPKDSYPRLENAMVIDETAALKAASWGLGQVLGENHRSLGFATPEAMVLAFMDDEEKHVEGMVQFLIANKIDDDLRAHRWDAVARVYNGPGYAKHNYHGRMKAAFAKWQKVKDTAWKPEPAETPARLAPLPPVLSSVAVTSLAEPTPVASLEVSKEVVMHVQTLLTEKGYHSAGPIDGDAGGRTQEAILAFRNEAGLPLVNTIDQELIDALEVAPKRYIAPDRANVTVKEAMAKDMPVAEPLRQNWWQRVIAWVSGLGGTAVAAGSGLVDNLGEANEKATPVRDALGSIPIWAYGLVVVAIAGLLVLSANRSDKKLVDMTRSGQVV